MRPQRPTLQPDLPALDKAAGKGPLGVVLEFHLPAGHHAIDVSCFDWVGVPEFELLLNGGEFLIAAVTPKQVPRLTKVEYQDCVMLRLEPLTDRLSNRSEAPAGR